MKAAMICALSLIVILHGTESKALSTTEVDHKTDAQVLDQTVAALCDRQIAMLGENGFHGDGKTAAFKADLVGALIDRCGFGVVAFESGAYDFIAIERSVQRGEPITRDMVASAIGGLWNQNAEIQPLIDDLRTRTASGRLLLVGLDDQLGSLGSFYSLEAMPAELASALGPDRQIECAASLKQRIWSGYTREAPYTEETRAALARCLEEIEAAGVARPDDRDATRRIIANFRRTLARDFQPGLERLAGRDASMLENLEAAARDSDGRPRKVIVWAGNSHVAKASPDGSPYETRPNLGALAAERFGSSAYALGFSAAGGMFRYTVRTAREIAEAAAGSLEQRALADSADQEIVFRDTHWLDVQDAIVGSAFGDHKPVLFDWATAYDGIIVFRRERPPFRLDEQ